MAFTRYISDYLLATTLVDRNLNLAELRAGSLTSLLICILMVSSLLFNLGAYNYPLCPYNNPANMASPFCIVLMLSLAGRLSN